MVERRDIGDHADRAAQRIAEVVAVDGNNRIALRQCQARIVTEQVWRLGKLRARFTRRSPVIQGLHLIEFVQVFFELLAEMINELGAASLRHFSPRRVLERTAATGYGGVDVGFAGVDGMGNDLPVAGRDNGKGLARTRWLFLAVDEQASNGLGFSTRHGVRRLRLVHFHLPGVFDHRGGRAKRQLQPNWTAGKSIIYRSITLYFLEYNEANISLTPGGHTSDGSRLVTLEDRATWSRARRPRLGAIRRQVIRCRSKTLQQQDASWNN